MSNVVFGLEKVFKRFESSGVVRDVLNDVSLTLREGERVSLVGPNGSGKSTLLRISLGLDIQDSGSVHAVSLDLGPVGFVPQDYRSGLFPWLNLKQNLLLPFRNDGPRSSEFAILERYDATARLFGFSADLTKYPYQLSGGEQQIFSLIRALTTMPRLLVLDEPLAAVDFGRRQAIVHHLADWLVAHPCGLVAVSHSFDEAILLADRVYVLSTTGKIVQNLEVRLPWPRRVDMRLSAEYQDQLAVLTRHLAL